MPFTVFHKDKIVARGEETFVAEAVRNLGADVCRTDLMTFDDDTGKRIDIEIASACGPRPRGRPPLGVEAREVTLLPRHWEWLATQRGSASVTLRRLIESAMRDGRSERDCKDAACRFLTVTAGNRPGYEEAVRALYAGDRDNFDALCVLWPSAIARYARGLAWPNDAQERAA